MALVKKTIARCFFGKGHEVLDRSRLGVKNNGAGSSKPKNAVLGGSLRSAATGRSRVVA